MNDTSTVENTGLPNNWETKHLGEVSVILDNLRKPITKRDREEGEYPYYGATGILSYINDYIFDEKLVLIGEDGAKWFSGANTSFIVNGKYWVNNHAHVLRPIRTILLDEWIVYFLNFSDLEEYVTGMTVPKLNQGNLKKILIPLPPLPQQKQIVATLDKAFAAIDTAKANAEQNLKNAKELFENTLQILFDNKDWENKKLGEVASFKNGMNFTKSSVGQSIEIVGVKNFKNKFWVPFKELEKVTLDGDMSEEYQLKRGDILTVRSNGNPKLIGRTLLADEVNGNVSHSGFTIRIRLNPNSLLPVFLCHYLKTSRARKELVDSGNGVGIKSLNQGSLSSLMIPCPKSEEEQKLIVNKIEGFSKQTKKLEAIYTQKIADLEELKKSVLQKAFSGQLNTVT